MIYKITKGKHPCSPRRPIWAQPGKTMSGSFQLGIDCWYETAKIGTHLNKLVGFGTDLLGLNSVRLAWRPHKDLGKFEIYAYVHLNGSWLRQSPLKLDLVAVVDITTQFFSITAQDQNAPSLIGRMLGASATNQEAIFAVADGEVHRHYPVSIGSGFIMYPYFGGTSVAPNDMEVEVEWEWV